MYISGKVAPNNTLTCDRINMYRQCEEKEQICSLVMPATFGRYSVQPHQQSPHSDICSFSQGIHDNYSNHVQLLQLCVPFSLTLSDTLRLQDLIFRAICVEEQTAPVCPNTINRLFSMKMWVALWENRTDFNMSLAYCSSKIDIKYYRLHHLAYTTNVRLLSFFLSNSFPITLFVRFFIISLLLASVIRSMVTHCS